MPDPANMSTCSQDFLTLCEQAKCAPDFPAVLSLPPGEDAEWLWERLARYGHDHPLEDVVEAMNSWGRRPGGIEHHVGTLRL